MRSSPSVPSPSTAKACSSRRNHGSIEVRRPTSSISTPAKDLEQHVESIGRGRLEPGQQLLRLAGEVRLRVELSRAHRLRERLAERAADRHRLADRLHVGGQRPLGSRELLEREPRDLGDHVVDRGLERRRRDPGDVVVDLLERVAAASFAAIFAIGKPVAFEASAEERDTRGFISMTTISPVAGLTANWMLEPPVSTPTARITRSAWSRSSW